MEDMDAEETMVGREIKERANRWISRDPRGAKTPFQHK